jgi:hypothetical protein
MYNTDAPFKTQAQLQQSFGSFGDNNTTRQMIYF